ncbi:peptidase M16 domain-containing protein [Cyclospora cayetanensis]|uniref:Peptidase M16 domain-containing protein n=1 Tax=Cyclospora cayetanensis TaxID=88456 RepID=A0A1D3CYQ6_9EIME|nr:peptidase M16 domain-containing protein [Cyclospora cayetanensis]
MLPATAPRSRPPSQLPPPGGGAPFSRHVCALRLSGGQRVHSKMLASSGASAAAEGAGGAAPLQDGPGGERRSLHVSCAPLRLHPYLQRKVLASGLEVFMLPHGHPEGSLEVHLEIHAGSTAEEDSERGMAHLCEHLIFMGNRKRGDVVALQGEANAFTDFHHTVYFVSWRGGENAQGADARGNERETMLTDSQAGSRRKLKVALELLREVFTAPTQFTPERLLKEKAAVLSESSLVNTIFYRKEQAQLSKLHSDTLLPSRFPIGDMRLLRGWNLDEVHKFFARYYRPDNATLFIVGDVAPLGALRSVDEVLGVVRGDKAAEKKWRATRDKWRQTTVKNSSIFFPPLAHAWVRDFKGNAAKAAGEAAAGATGKVQKDVKSETSGESAVPLKNVLRSRLQIWQHSLLQNFSLLFLRKLPIVPLRTAGDFFRLLARKLALQALAMRLNERCRREDDAWMRVEVADTESIKEGCRIVSVEAEAEQGSWRDAVRVAVEEVRQMAKHGLTMSELRSLLDSYRANLDRMHMQLLSSADMLRLLMESSACGHRIIHLEDERGLALKLAMGKLEESSSAKSASALAASDDAAANPEDMKRLLDLVNAEARCMLSWIDARNCRSNVKNGPDAICTFLVQPGGTRCSSPPMTKRLPGTQLIGHVEVEPRDATTGFLEAATLPKHAEEETSQEVNSTTFAISEESILDELCSSMTRAVRAQRKGVETPKLLLTDAQLASLQQRAARSPPISRELQEAGPNARTVQLGNGVKVTVKPLPEERGSVLIRVLMPGGRLGAVMKNSRGDASSGSLESLKRQSAAMVLGARTMMEGGALGPFSREQIEGFCHERLIGVNIECLDEFLAIDISAPAFAARDADSNRAGSLDRASTLESAMQLLHLIFTNFRFEESAFRRAQQQTLMDYHAYTRDLVGYSLGELIVHMTGRDPRFEALKPAVTRALDLPFVEQQIRSHIAEALLRGDIEVTVVGDIDAAHITQLAAKYLGTIEPSKTDKEMRRLPRHLPAPLRYPREKALRSPYFHLQETSAPSAVQEWGSPHEITEPLSSGTWTKAWGRRLHAYVRDSETRAVVHIGGFACNRWGRNPDGSWIWEHMDALQRQDDSLEAAYSGASGGSRQQTSPPGGSAHRRHPAFPRVCLWILQELVTKRLFSILREEQRLTYEAAFEVMSFDILSGGIFVITVHTQPEEVERVLAATHVALQELISIRPLLQSQLEGAKQQVIGRHLHDRKYARYWLDLLGGLQMPDIPQKTAAYFKDFERVVESVTLQDIQLLLRSLGTRRDSMWEAVGVSGPVPPATLSRPPQKVSEVPIPSSGRSSTRLSAAFSAL